MNLHHLAVGAREPGPLAAFYRDLIGLPEVGRQHTPDGSLRSVWLDLGGAILMVERTGEPPRRVAGVGAGPFLLAFAVDPQRREELARALEGSGYPVEHRTEHTIYFRDPEGNRVAASSHPLAGDRR